MGSCLSIADEPTRPAAVQQQTPYVERVIYDPPKPTAPPPSAPAMYYPQQGYTYAVRPQQQQAQMPPWATQVYQYPPSYQPSPYQPGYQPSYPQYTGVPQQTRPSNGNGALGVAGGMVAGMLIASALDSDPDSF